MQARTLKFGFKKRNCTITVAKTKALKTKALKTKALSLCFRIGKNLVFSRCGSVDDVDDKLIK